MFVEVRPHLFANACVFDLELASDNLIRTRIGIETNIALLRMCFGMEPINHPMFHQLLGKVGLASQIVHPKFNPRTHLRNYLQAFLLEIIVLHVDILTQLHDLLRVFLAGIALHSQINTSRPSQDNCFILIFAPSLRNTTSRLTVARSSHGARRFFHSLLSPAYFIDPIRTHLPL